MSEISVLDLQNLRHLIGGYDTTHCKMTDYANQAQDPQVKQLFQDAANSAMKNKQDLMKFLWEGGKEDEWKNNGFRCSCRSKRRIKNVWRNHSTNGKQRIETMLKTDGLVDNNMNIIDVKKEGE